MGVTINSLDQLFFNEIEKNAKTNNQKIKTCESCTHNNDCSMQHASRLSGNGDCFGCTVHNEKDRAMILCTKCGNMMHYKGMTMVNGNFVMYYECKQCGVDHEMA